MIIGLSGLSGSGKTTIAVAIEGETGAHRLSFADPLKAMTRALGLSASEMAGPLKEQPCEALCGKTPRQFMQLLGTEFGRDLIGRDFWVRAWLRRVEGVELAALCDGVPPRIVADDIRFHEEADAIRALGGFVVRLTRQGAGSASGGGHESEAMDFKVDAEVENAGSPTSVALRVIDLARRARRA